jgi:hypothetical protein
MRHENAFEERKLSNWLALARAINSFIDFAGIGGAPAEYSPHAISEAGASPDQLVIDLVRLEARSIMPPAVATPSARAAISRKAAPGPGTVIDTSRSAPRTAQAAGQTRHDVISPGGVGTINLIGRVGYCSRVAEACAIIRRPRPPCGRSHPGNRAPAHCSRPALAASGRSTD